MGHGEMGRGHGFAKQVVYALLLGSLLTALPAVLPLFLPDLGEKLLENLSLVSISMVGAAVGTFIIARLLRGKSGASS